MPKRRNKKTETKRLAEENEKLRRWNRGWQIAYDGLWRDYMDLVDKLHGRPSGPISLMTREPPHA